MSHAVIDFTHAHHQLFKGERPLEKLLKVHIKEALTHQKELEPIFVSPGDLLSQCTSLHEITWP